MIQASDLTRRAKEVGVPEHLIEGLVAYATDRRPTGGFLQAVLSNDLFEAMKRADSKSLAGIVRVTAFIYHNFPFDSFGSPEIVAAWLSKTNSETLKA